MTSQPPNSGLQTDPGGGRSLAPAPTVVAISSNEMGRGDDELGQVLLRNYLRTLREVTPGPDTIIFFNSGVMLTVEGSPALDDLTALVDQGVQLLLCRSCVEYFDLEERVAVGEISNMYAISEAMLRAGKVINL